jgi:homeobox protein cut-like
MTSASPPLRAAPASPAASPPGAPLSSAAAIPTVLDAWIGFDLDGRRARLDEEGLQIPRRQDASAQARKDLAVSTRAFKRSRLPGPDATAEQGAAAGKAFTALLKQYQGEVDALTSRAKSSEAAFLELYKALYEVPDPVVDLKHGATDRATVAQLREELRAMRAEHSGLAERSEAARDYEGKIEEMEVENKALVARVAEEVKLQVEEKQTAWMTAQRKTVEAYEMREQELLHQLSEANDTLRGQQAGADMLKTQRDAALAQLEDIKAARSAGAEMMQEDGARAHEEVNDLRRRCAKLEAQLAVMEEGDEAAAAPLVAGEEVGREDARKAHRRSTSLAGRSALSADLAARDVEISQLKDQVAVLEEVLTGKDKAKSAEFSRLTRSIQDKDVQIATLTKTVEALPTVGEFETMKRQFEALKEYQLNDGDVEGDDEAMSAVTSATGAEPGGSNPAGPVKSGPRPSADLEKRLLGKLKVMESKSTALRVALSGKDSRIEELSAMVRSLEERNDDQKALISKLEDGINAMTGDPSSIKSLKPRYAVSSETSGVALSGSSSAGAEYANGDRAAEQDGEDDGADGVTAWDWGEQQQAEGLQRIIREEPTMLDIVAGQRDRFRARTLELETENQKMSERLEKVTTDKDALQTDNVRLYEKIRYLQSYAQSASAQRGVGGGGSSTRAADVAPASSAGSVVIGIDEDEGTGGFLNQYRSMYEEMVNPYTLFNRRERHKRISEMSAPERLTLRATQRAVSSKTSRLFVFAYMLCLHLLVFVVLVFVASPSTCPGSDITTKAQH